MVSSDMKGSTMGRAMAFLTFDIFFAVFCKVFSLAAFETDTMLVNYVFLVRYRLLLKNMTVSKHVLSCFTMYRAWQSGVSLCVYNICFLCDH